MVAKVLQMFLTCLVESTRWSASAMKALHYAPSPTLVALEFVEERWAPNPGMLRAYENLVTAFIGEMHDVQGN